MNKYYLSVICWQRRYAKEGKKYQENYTENYTEKFRENPNITTRELAEEIEITPRAVHKIIKKLKEKNKLVRIGPDKGGY